VKGDADKAGKEANKKRKRKRTPGVLFELSKACRNSARELASSSVFASVYDNINMMFRVAEQILGRHSQ
jgi:hypothetical protein